MTASVSLDMRRLNESARQHGFALPQCRSCGHRFYPPQAWCPQCLACDVAFPADSGHGAVLSMTRVHRSLDEAWNSRLPVHVACVRTHSGVNLFAMADAALPRGSPVIVCWSDGLFRISAERPEDNQ